MRVCAKAPPPRDSEYSKEGTEAHAVLEKLLVTPEKERKKLVGSLVKQHGSRGDFLPAVMSAADEVFARAAARPQASLLTETRVDLSFIAPDTFGTTDVSLVEEFGLLEIMDYKHGAGVGVEVAENTQLIMYALGIAHQYDYNFSSVRMTVLQPRKDHADGVVRSWDCSIDDLLAWKEKLIAGVQKCEASLVFNDHDGKDLANGEWCRFCPGAVICPKLSEQALKEARVDFCPEIGVVETMPIAELNPTALSDLLPAFDKLETWMAEVRAYALESLRTGGKIPGYKLVEKRATRKWANIEEVTEEAKREFGEEAFVKELLSPAQFEKAFKGEKDWVAMRTVAISSGVTIAPESDKRPAVNQIEEDFGVVEAAPEVSETKHKRASKKDK